VLKEKD